MALTEIVSKRRKDRKVFVDENGRQIIRKYAVPVHFDQNGQMIEKDTNFYLNTTADPAYYAFNTINNTFRVGLASDLSVDRAFKYANRNKCCGELYETLIGMFLYDSSSGQRAVICRPNVFRGSIEGNVAKYPNVYDGVDYEFHSELDGVKAFIYINDRSWIPDPVLYGFNPDTTYITFVNKIEYVGMSPLYDGENIEFYEHEIKSVYSPKEWARSSSGFSLDVINDFNYKTGEYTFGLPYSQVMIASLPITIDPTWKSVDDDTPYIAHFMRSMMVDRYNYFGWSLVYNWGTSINDLGLIGYDFTPGDKANPAHHKSYRSILRYDLSDFELPVDEITKADLKITLVTTICPDPSLQVKALTRAITVANQADWDYTTGLLADPDAALTSAQIINNTVHTLDITNVFKDWISGSLENNGLVLSSLENEHNEDYAHTQYRDLVQILTSTNYPYIEVTLPDLATPTGFSYEQIRSDRVRLYWTNNSAVDTYFEIYDNGVLTWTTGVNVEEFYIDTVPGKTYNLTIVSTNGTSSSGHSSSLIFTSNMNVILEPVSSTTVKITVNENLQYGGKYEIYKNDVLVDTVFASAVLNRDITGFTPNETADIRVKTYDDQGALLLDSGQKSVTSYNALLPPTLSYGLVTDTSIQWTFEAGANQGSVIGEFRNQHDIVLKMVTPGSWTDWAQYSTTYQRKIRLIRYDEYIETDLVSVTTPGRTTPTQVDAGVVTLKWAYTGDGVNITDYGAATDVGVESNTSRFAYAGFQSISIPKFSTINEAVLRIGSTSGGNFSIYGLRSPIPPIGSPVPSISGALQSTSVVAGSYWDLTLNQALLTELATYGCGVAYNGQSTISTVMTPLGTHPPQWSSLKYTPPLAPDVPASFSGVKLTSSSIRWSWPVVDRVTEYRVYDGLDQLVYILEMITGGYEVRDKNNQLITTVMQDTSASITFDETNLAGTYTRKVTAKNDSGESPYTASATVTADILAAPIVSLVSKDHNSISISWTPIADAAKYRVYDVDADGSNPVMISEQDHPDVDFIDVGLSAFTTYYYRVSAVEADGTEGYLSDIFPVTTDHSVTISGLALSSKMINWIPSSADPAATRFEIWRGAVKLYDGSGVFTERDLTPSTEYSVTVKSFNGDTLIDTNTGSASTRTAMATPPAPTGVAVTYKSINWTIGDPIPDATHYEIVEYYMADQFYRVKQTIQAGTLTWLEDGLRYDTSYQRAIRAINRVSDITGDPADDEYTDFSPRSTIVTTLDRPTQTITNVTIQNNDIDPNKIADARIIQGSNQNYGANTYLTAGSPSSAGAIERSLIKIDLSNYTIGDLTVADLQLYTNGSLNSNPVMVDVHRVIEDWTEAGVKWGNAPDFDQGMIEASRSVGPNGAWYTFDIKGLVNKWIKGQASNFGLLLKARDESALSTLKGFYSSNYNTNKLNRPKLTLSWLSVVAPDAPSNLNVSQLDMDMARWSWSAARYAEEYLVYDVYHDTLLYRLKLIPTGYELYDPNNELVRIVTQDTSEVVTLDEGVAPGQPYSRYVTALNTLGESKASNQKTVQTITTPGNFQVVVNGQIINYSWEEVPWAKGYRLYTSDHTLIAETGVTLYQQTGAERSQSVHVVAYNDYNESLPTPDVEVLTTPNSPTNLVLTAISDRIRLAWTDNSNIESAFVIEKKVGGGPWEEISNECITNTYDDVFDYDLEITYQYRVKAVNATGSSAAYASASVVLPQPPAIFQGGYSDGMARLAWIDNSGVETHYRVKYSINGGAEQTEDVTSVSTTEYGRVYSWAKAMSAVSTITARVCAIQNSVAGPDSASLVVNAATYQPDPAPTDLRARWVSPGRVEYQWTGNTDRAIKYRLEYSIYHNNAWGPTQYADVPVTPGETGQELSVQLDNNVDGDTIRAQVKSISLIDESPLSTPPVSKLYLLVEPITPQRFRKEQTHNGILLKWDPVDDVDNYTIHYKLGDQWYVGTTGPGVLQFDIEIDPHAVPTNPTDWYFEAYVVATFIGGWIAEPTPTIRFNPTINYVEFETFLVNEALSEEYLTSGYIVTEDITDLYGLESITSTLGIVLSSDLQEKIVDEWQRGEYPYSERIIDHQTIETEPIMVINNYGTTSKFDIATRTYKPELLMDEKPFVEKIVDFYQYNTDAVVGTLVKNMGVRGEGAIQGMIGNFNVIQCEYPIRTVVYEQVTEDGATIQTYVYTPLTISAAILTDIHKIRICTLGDSITAGHPGYWAESGTGRVTSQYQYWLQKRLGADFEVLNNGYGSDTTVLCLNRFDRDITSKSPDYVIINAGTNDLARAQAEKKDDQAHLDFWMNRARDNFVAMVDKAVANGIVPIITTIIPRTTAKGIYRRGLHEFNQWIIQYANSRPDCYYVDWYNAGKDFIPPMPLEEPGAWDPESGLPGNLNPLYDGDSKFDQYGNLIARGYGVHPSDLGYKIMADAIPLSIFTSIAADVALFLDDKCTISETLDETDKLNKIYRMNLNVLNRGRVKKTTRFIKNIGNRTIAYALYPKNETGVDFKVSLNGSNLADALSAQIAPGGIHRLDFEITVPRLGDTPDLELTLVARTFRQERLKEEG